MTIAEEGKQVIKWEHLPASTEKAVNYSLVSVLKVWTYFKMRTNFIICLKKERQTLSLGYVAGC